MAAKTKTEHYYSAHNGATTVGFDTCKHQYMTAITDVDRIFVGLS